MSTPTTQTIATANAIGTCDPIMLQGLIDSGKTPQQIANAVGCSLPHYTWASAALTSSLIGQRLGTMGPGNTDVAFKPAPGSSHVMTPAFIQL